jgi:hypothetical protein
MTTDGIRAVTWVNGHSQPDYTGPLVGTLGGADISWLAGWFAAATAYLVLVAVTAGTPAPEAAGEPR